VSTVGTDLRPGQIEAAGLAATEGHGMPIRAGSLVAWWDVRKRDGRKRRAVYCITCHHHNVRAGRALQ